MMFLYHHGRGSPRSVSLAGDMSPFVVSHLYQARHKYWCRTALCLCAPSRRSHSLLLRVLGVVHCHTFVSTCLDALHFALYSGYRAAMCPWLLFASLIVGAGTPERSVLIVTCVSCHARAYAHIEKTPVSVTLSCDGMLCNRVQPISHLCVLSPVRRARQEHGMLQ